MASDGETPYIIIIYGREMGDAPSSAQFSGSWDSLSLNLPPSKYLHYPVSRGRDAPPEHLSSFRQGVCNGAPPFGREEGLSFFPSRKDERIWPVARPSGGVQFLQKIATSPRGPGHVGRDKPRKRGLSMR